MAQKFLDVHHMDDFMYLNLNMNPHAPQVPGAPGLFFDADDMVEPVDDSWSKIKRVFSRIDSAQWEYMGQYKMEPVASLTMEEWNEQRNTVSKITTCTVTSIDPEIRFVWFGHQSYRLRDGEFIAEPLCICANNSVESRPREKSKRHSEVKINTGTSPRNI